MIKKSLYRLYFIAGGAFLLALTKYLFVEETELSPRFFIVEFISFSLFLAVVYLFDRFIREQKKRESVARENLNAVNQEHKNKVGELEQIIARLKGDQANNHRNDKEIEALAQRVTSGLIDLGTKKDFSGRLLNNLAQSFEIGLGICYFQEEPSRGFAVESTYGIGEELNPKGFVIGEGLNGQAVADKQNMVLEDIDEDYFNVESCSGSSKPRYIYMLPIVRNDESIGLIELATFGNIRIDKQWELLNNYIVDVMSF